MTILFAIFLPLLGAFFMPLIGRHLKERTAWAAVPFALGSALCVAWLIPDAQESPVVAYDWVPSMGLSLSFLADGLAVFFGLVVSFMGVLILVYAGFYLDDHYRDHGRFYTYLLIFMSAMLGTVFSQNLLLLFIFWELTGIASFLLIGFNHDTRESREGSRMALLVTGAGGLVMLAGLVLLGQWTGTMNLTELLRGPLPSSFTRNGNLVMVLILIGAFSKSAQFPLHFWLPRAMAAPTPVSAYLHSATMVKLGVFLAARLFPVFKECSGWLPVLTVLCFGTMLLGAVLAFLAFDLKAILAYSTISQLGFLLGYYGLAPRSGVEFDYLHILNHVFYKGCLFMCAGVIDHANGTRDIRDIGGLWRRMPLLAVITLVCCASMAGLPGTSGFVSKEYMLKEVFQNFGDHPLLGPYALGMVILTSLIKVAFTARIFHRVFLGPETETVKRRFHAPARSMMIPPLILAVATVLFGLFPAWCGRGLAVLEVPGLHNMRHGDLTLWHGVTRELLVSGAIVTVGLLIYLARRTWVETERAIPDWIRLDRSFEILVGAFGRFTVVWTRWLRADRPLDYLPILLTFLLLVVGGAVWKWGLEDLRISSLQGGHALRGFIALLIAVAVVLTARMPRWTTQLICLSVAGFLISLYFILHRAPDLALTQVLVETATLILMLLLLGRFRQRADTYSRSAHFGRARRFWNWVLAGGAGLLATALVLIFSRPALGERVGDVLLNESLPLADGSNAVNTTLIDFRGLDTLGEIAVLVITTLGCLGLLMRYRRTREEYEKGPMGPAGFGLNHPEEEEPR